MSAGRLLNGAASEVERRRAFEMGRRPFQPNQAIVVHVGKDGSDGTSFRRLHARRFRSPGARIHVFQEKLVHAVIRGISFQQDFANV